MTDPIGTAQKRKALDALRTAADICELDENPVVARQAVRIRAAIVSLQSRIAEVGRLTEAGQRVLDGLNTRIDAADPAAVPIFDGIAELHAALSLHRRPT